jgi:hypothetical protein
MVSNDDDDDDDDDDDNNDNSSLVFGKARGKEITRKTKT